MNDEGPDSTMDAPAPAAAPRAAVAPRFLPVGEKPAKAFLRLPLLSQIGAMHVWVSELENGTPSAEFDAWAMDMVDTVIFPFSPGSQWERYSDMLLGMLAASDGMAAVRRMAVQYVAPLLHTLENFAPLAGLADKLPD